MPETQYCLLDESVIRVQGKGDPALTLPGVLAALSGGDSITSFSALQVHQSHAWHMFLVQLAAIALHAGGRGEPPHDEAAWRTLLLGLTDSRTEPWTLVVEDLAQPAFLQPPVPEGTLKGFKAAIHEPSAVDVLVTTKNHDVKRGRIAAARPDHWIYALVSLQTMEGYSGRANYGIARMNSGYGSRPLIAFRPGLLHGQNFRRDLRVVLGQRDTMAQVQPYRKEGGLTLLWLEPWDGTASLTIDACDPLFIEIARRLRLVRDDDGIRCHLESTDAPRLDAKDILGNTGDPWTPVRKTDSAAFTVSAWGFGYARAQELLCGGDYQPGPAGAVHADDAPELQFIAMALARGQGTTAGWHSRTIPVPGHIRRLLGRPDQRAALGTLASDRVNSAGLARYKVLGFALRVLFDDDIKRGAPQSFLVGFDRAVDTIFFDELWRAAEGDRDEADRRWEQQLLLIAQAQLNLAIDSAPFPSARRYRRIAAAERAFWGSWRKQFPAWSPPERRSA